MITVLMTFAFCFSAMSHAMADVDTYGSLRKSTTSLGAPLSEAQPMFEKASGDYECSGEYYSNVQSAADSWVIGNCKAPWQIEVVSYSGPNGEGVHSYGGFVTGAFSGCGWIEARIELEKINGKTNSACGEGSTGDFKVPTSDFMERHNSDIGDGWPVVNTQACPEYLNYRPWSPNNVEQELVRTAPAYATSGPGSNYPALKWRYISKYESTDGTHRYVMVHDDRYGRGEGDWVFVPRSCLPSSLPENENERVPYPPAATTNAASEVTTSGATLNGAINPNGLDTYYHFEYGPTISYGTSTSTEDAGAGTAPIGVSANVSGLAAGTTYYFRIVATSPTGTTYGGPVAFTTLSPPTATTDAASEIREGQATLNGAVDPNGTDAHYYFQYGETTSYSASTGEVDAGSGVSPVPASTTITGLEPGTTYHYRLVAYNTHGISYGADQAFNTIAQPRPFVTQGSSTSIYYNSNGSLEDSWFDGKEWHESGIPGSRSITDNPFAIQEGTTSIYYNSNGSLWDSWFDGKEWHDSAIPAALSIVGSPFATQTATTTSIYYNSEDKLEDSWFNGKEWSESGVPSSVSITDEPFVIQTETTTSIYYNSNGTLEDSWFDGKEWHESRVPSSVSITGDPFVIQTETTTSIYYNSNGTLEDSWFDGKEWHESAIPRSQPISSDPFVVQGSEPSTTIYYNSSGTLEDSWFAGGEWHESAVPNSLSITGDPFAIGSSIYYDSNSALEDSWWAGEGWDESGIPDSLPIT